MMGAEQLGGPFQFFGRPECPAAREDSDPSPLIEDFRGVLQIRLVWKSGAARIYIGGVMCNVPAGGLLFLHFHFL